MGNGTRINSSALIQGCGDLEIGDNVWIGPKVHIMADGGAKVAIGDNVDIAPHVFIGTGSHEIDRGGVRVAGRGYNKSITIGKGSWICAGAMILPGVEIGDMAIVAAGAVALHDVEPRTIVAGVPARKERDL